MANDVLTRRIATAAALACVAVVAITIAAIAIPSFRMRLGLVAHQAPSYRVGEGIDIPSRIYGSSASTLVLFVRSNCAACQSAKPAIKNIVERLKATNTPVFVIAVAAHGVDDVGFATELGVDHTRFVALDASTLRLRVVPTLVLVNRKGAVLFASEGAPSDQQQRQLLDRVRSEQSPR